MATTAENPIRLQQYRLLPPEMYQEVDPTPASQPELLELNRGLLAEYGIDPQWFETPEGLDVLSGNAVIAANAPIAMAYAGHQFGHWVPQLGDGRAHMLGQLTAADGFTFDVQLKGSGRTRFSRGGDGRATLGSVVREYVISEAMAGLGIATSRSLAIIGTGEPVFREEPEPGAILVRTAASHIRVGSFQYAAAHLGPEALRRLADHVIERNYPNIVDAELRYAELLSSVIARQARLVAQWMLVGFIHGVMNTDNMSVAGETIDFGPCAFIDEFQFDKVFSSIDRHGRYAWDQQANVAHWNLTQLAATLLPLIDADEDRAVAVARERLAQFTPQFNEHFYAGMRAKLGLSDSIDAIELESFTRETLQLLGDQSVDFTLFFDALTRIAQGADQDDLLDLFARRESVGSWLRKWQSMDRLSKSEVEIMRLANPAVIARNHRVEQVIAAANEGNPEPMRRLCSVLSTPFTLAKENADLKIPPQPHERVTRTFCGT
jgi:uncharacterized protein YdiU (UPF0061 family)